jgi:hypothetical protein
MPESTTRVDVEGIDASIRMLRSHVDSAEIEPLVLVLETIKQRPDDESLLEQLSEAFEHLGFTQGAVLTYAPYITLLLSDDPYEQF